MANNDRKALIEAVKLAGREMSASSVFFHSLMAKGFGLTITDWRAWDLVLRHGPLTAGELAQRTGLTPGAVTGLIDRLVDAGAVERLHDGQDRRKVIVRATENRQHHGEAHQLFAPMLRATEKLYASYSNAQLRLVADFMKRMAVLLREHTVQLTNID